MAEAVRPGEDDPVTIWSPQPKQEAFITCPADDVGFGGARGGGKSDGVVGDWLDHEDRYAASAIGMAFRRERTQLVELIERAKQVLVPLGHKWHEQEKYFRGPNGGRLRFTYLERDSDADAYQGHSYSRLYPEEMGTFPSETPINKLQATLRSGNGVPCQMKGTCNPGGVGHQWVRARYRLDVNPRGFELFEFEFVNPFTGRKVVKRRTFIPSRVSDNRYLGDDYVANLFQVGSTALVRAWLEGDWSVIEGAFFDCWSAEKHVVPPFEIPDHWARARSFDWGFAKPFSVGWWAVASEPRKLSNGLTLPRGGIVRYREWYGAAGPDTGIRLQAEQIAEGIRSREKGETMAISVGDPAIWAEAGASHGVPGPSIGEKMAKAGAPFSPADNRRKQGWDQFRGRLLGDAEGNPMMIVFSTCTDFIRTVPVLQHDKLKPEDVDTEAEDHCFTGETSVLTSAGARRIDSLVGEDGVVLSADGAWHAYRSARLVERDARILAVRFDDGSVVRCTPDHRFMTEVGWTEAQHLAGMAILSWSAPRSRNLPASGSISADAISSARGGGCTSPFGRAHTALCRRAIMFIIGLAATTTGCPILNASPRGSILAFAMVPTLANAAGEQFGRRQSALGSGTAVRLGASGTVSNMSFIARRLLRLVSNAAAIIATANSALRARASIARPTAEQQPGENPVSTTSIGPAPHVAVHSSPIGTRGRGRAAPSAGGQYVAGWLRCLSVTPAGREDVYCLTVPDTGNFVLANGAVVANCADEARYFCMSRPWARPTPQPAGPVIDTRIPAIADLVKAAERRRVTNRRI